MWMEIDGETIKCILQWKIRNFSHSLLLKEGERITSPSFISDELEGAKLSLELHFAKDQGVAADMRVRLYRPEDCNGPVPVDVDVTLGFVWPDGSLRAEEKHWEYYLIKDDGTTSAIIDKDDVFFHERENLLPEDTLTVQCTLKKGGSKVDGAGHERIKYLYAQTVLNVNRKSFDSRIENFSADHPDMIDVFQDPSIEFNLLIDDKEKEIKTFLIPRKDGIKYISCETSIVDSNRKKESKEIAKYFAGDIRKVIVSVLPFMSEVVENENNYLPNDVLTLCFDIALLEVEHSDWKIY